MPVTNVPRNANLDATRKLASDGYLFAHNQRRELQSDIFETRLLMRKVTCIVGEEAAEIFYDTGKFERQGVTPSRVQKTLFGEGGVQGMDDEAHRWRKLMFMSLMTPDRLNQLADQFSNDWDVAVVEWESMMDEVRFFAEVEKIILRTVCAWAGVPLPDADVRQRTADVSAMIEGAGAVGPTHWKGRAARARSEKWIKGLIDDVRKQRIDVPANSALRVFALHRDLNGKLLDKQAVAVDILNVIRPTVAVGRFIVFAALALHDYPEYRKKIRHGDDRMLEAFIHEVRRFYPFFPFQMARTRKKFTWRGYEFPKGRRVMLDLYGTNHDPRSWKDSDRFWPERFIEEDPTAFNFVPQGGGDHYGNHRCPGEWMTIELMKVAIRKLATEMSYELPEQDLSIDLTTMPTAPASGFIISNVRKLSTTSAES
jgi:fatty-acid peroxygenase